LLKVQAEAFFAASGGIIQASKLCSDTLKKINDQVDILRNEIQNSHTTVQAQQLRDVVDFGNAHVALIKASLGSPQAARGTVPTTLAVLSDHLSRVTQDLLPAGDIKLNAKAKAALEELFKLVKSFREVPEQTGLAQQEYQCRIAKIRTDIDGIRDSMFLASSSVTDAEMITSTVGQQEARNKAAEMIDQVKAKVEALKTNSKPCLEKNAADTATTQPEQSQDKAVSVPRSATDLLIALLEGTARVVRNPQLISRLDNRTDRPTFLPAKFDGSSAAAESLFDRVQRAISDTCPRGTAFKTAWCINLILGPLGFPDPQTRIPLIAGVLVLFPCWTGDKNALIGRLAALK
jgi:hypothetical protein